MQMKIKLEVDDEKETKKNNKETKYQPMHVEIGDLPE